MTTYTWGPIRTCRCGVEVQSMFLGLAPVRTFEVASGEVHRCPQVHAEIRDLHQCNCGAVVIDYRDGRRRNRDGSPHVCGAPQRRQPQQSQGPRSEPVLRGVLARAEDSA
jgi:hypothetical protein